MSDHQQNPSQNSDSCILPSPKNRNPIKYSLDVITDGSNLTGSGTLFFSILRQSMYNNNGNNNKNPHCECNDDVKDETIMARYAFGCSELTGRLCADQRQKVGEHRKNEN
mmetsp:Transcript_49782/g.74001  ORF Transcript_49782/g.74001 Transcript_49782/m.74001 type:complete len:110 (+) Transcript_49782:153-482(+)